MRKKTLDGRPDSMKESCYLIKLDTGHTAARLDSWGLLRINEKR